MSQIFISYNHKDIEIMLRIKTELLRHFRDIWTDENILIGQSITREIFSALESSRLMLVVLTRNSANARWVEREIETQLSNEINTGNIRVLIALCDNLDGSWDIPILLKDKKYANLDYGFDTGIAELVNAIKAYFDIEDDNPIKEVNIDYFVLGFTLAKLAWLQSDSEELSTIQEQFRILANRLGISNEFCNETFRKLSNTTEADPLAIWKNAFSIRSSLQALQYGSDSENNMKSFDFGFEILNICPLLNVEQNLNDVSEIQEHLDKLYNRIFKAVEYFGNDIEIIQMVRESKISYESNIIDIAQNKLIEAATYIYDGH